MKKTFQFLILSSIGLCALIIQGCGVNDADIANQAKKSEEAGGAVVLDKSPVGNGQASGKSLKNAASKSAPAATTGG